MRNTISPLFIFNLFKTKIKQKKYKDISTSEIVGTILLLSIAITLVCGLYYLVSTVASNNQSTPAPSVNIVGMIHGNQIVFEHNGGTTLSVDTKFIITIHGDEVDPFSALGHFVDTNNDGWSIGECVSYTPDPTQFPTLLDTEIEATVVDVTSNQIIYKGLIQEGEQGQTAYVQTLPLDPINIGFYNATLKLYYGYPEGSQPDTAQVYFYWKAIDEETFHTTTSQQANQAGIYTSGSELVGLLSHKEYVYKAYLHYTIDSIQYTKAGDVLSFTTNSDIVGFWRFNELSGVRVEDSSEYDNYGFLKPTEKLGPQRILGGVEGESGDHCIQVDGLDDSVNIQDRPILHLPDAMSLEAHVYPSQYSSGEIGVVSPISGSQFDLFNYDCLEPDVIKVSEDAQNRVVYAVVSRNTNYMGYLVTIKVYTNGNIWINPDDTTCIYDKYQFEDAHCQTPKIIRIADTDFYAIVYTGSLYHGIIKTIGISAEGDITNPFVSTCDFSASCYNPDIIHVGDVSSTTYAVVYSYNTGGDTGKGRITRVAIGTNGDVSIAPSCSTYIFMDDHYQGGVPAPREITMVQPEIIYIEGSTNIYAIVYRDGDGDGSVLAVQIPSDCLDILKINQVTGYAPLDIQCQKKFETNYCQNPEIIQISSGPSLNIYAIVGIGTNFYKGMIYTISIDHSGSISGNAPCAIATLTFESLSLPYTYSSNPYIIPIKIDEGIFAVVYCRGVGNIKTLYISSDGATIQFIRYGMLEFDSYSAYTPKIILLAQDTTEYRYTLVYQFDYNDGVIKTLRINININNPPYTVGGIPDYPIIQAEELGHFSCFELATVYRPPQAVGEDPIIGIIGRNIDLSGYIKTYKIQADGGIPLNTFLNSFKIETGYPSNRTYWHPFLWCKAIHLDADYFAVIYYQDGVGVIATLRIDNAGAITKIDCKNFYTYASGGQSGVPLYPNICKIEGSTDKYAIVFGDYYQYFGEVRTVQIFNNGLIGTCPIDFYTFESFYCYTPYITHVKDNLYAITYQGYYEEGWLTTLEIGTDGIINHNVLDSTMVETGSYLNPKIQSITDDTCAVSYCGSLFGSSTSEFKSPQGVCADHDFVYVTDTGNHRVLRLVANTALDYDTSIGSYGTGIDQFKYPSGIYKDSDNCLYITDTGNNRIVKRNALNDMSYITMIGTLGDGDGQFNAPSGIWGDETYVYITDTGNNRIIRLIAANLQFSAKVGSLGSGNGQFIAPSGIWGDGTYLYVTDTKNNRTVQLRQDTLEFVSSFGSGGDGNSQFRYPTGITGDGTYLYITDTGNNRIVQYTIANPPTYKAQLGSKGRDYYKFEYPKSICWSTWSYWTQNVLYVTDTQNHRLVCRRSIDLSYTSMKPSTGYSGGWIKTLNIDEHGIIQNILNDTLTFENNYAINHQCISIENRIYALLYSGPNNWGTLKTIRIGENAGIPETYDRSYVYDTNYHSYYQNIIPIHDTTYAIVYASGYSGYDILVKTVSIIPTPTYQTILKKGTAYSINASGLNIQVTLKGVSGTLYTLSGTMQAGQWNTVVVTYTTTSAHLYINGVEVQTSTGQGLFYTSADLIFGNYNGLFDKFVIYAYELESGNPDVDMIPTLPHPATG